MMGNNGNDVSLKNLYMQVCLELKDTNITTWPGPAHDIVHTNIGLGASYVNLSKLLFAFLLRYLLRKDFSGCLSVRVNHMCFCCHEWTQCQGSEGASKEQLSS